MPGTDGYISHTVSTVYPFSPDSGNLSDIRWRTKRQRQLSGRNNSKRQASRHVSKIRVSACSGCQKILPYSSHADSRSCLASSITVHTSTYSSSGAKLPLRSGAPMLAVSRRCFSRPSPDQTDQGNSRDALLQTAFGSNKSALSVRQSSDSCGDKRVSREKLAIIQGTLTPTALLEHYLEDNCAERCPCTQDSASITEST